MFQDLQFSTAGIRDISIVFVMHFLLNVVGLVLYDGNTDNMTTLRYQVQHILQEAGSVRDYVVY